MKSLSHLPNEIIHTIVGQTECTERLLLSQTSRHIHAICLEIIYRNIKLDDPARTIKCCTTITSRMEAADSVRQLNISCYPNGDSEGFDTAVKSALRKMRNLQIMITCLRSLFDLFSDMHFPRLSACGLPPSLELGPFLQLNPMITTLAISPGPDGPCPNFAKSSIRPIHLPKLRRFAGPDISACSFVPASLVSHVAIYWNENPKLEFSVCLEAVARSNVDVTNLGNLVTSWDRSLLAAIADHLPHIQHLRILNMEHIPGANPSKELFFSAIDDALSSLTCLETLAIEGIERGRAEIDDDELDVEFFAVRRWGQISPSLSYVSLPSSTLWARIHDIWIPAGSENTAERSQWLINKVRTSPELPEGYHKVAGFFEAEEGMAALNATAEALRLQQHSMNMNSWM
ncbi:hypothetical protein FB451DRAFT_275110 [Mycena latifolia]|nr:hypothetical protein FB451DRAFT_275110 [Mycena latifolia]